MTILNDKTIPDLISLLYVHESGEKKEDKAFSKEKGFVLDICRDFQSAADILKIKQFDLIIIEPDKEALPDHLIKELSPSESTHIPVIFLSLEKYPENDFRLRFFSDGGDDFLIRPFTPEEVKKKIHIFLEKKHISRMNHALTRSLERTTGYLKRFKQELKKTKSELYEERISLNNALKQVNQMAKERARLKRDIKNLKEIFAGNLEGFFEVLSGLIKTRIERNRGHGDRVAGLAVFMAEQLRMDEKKISDLRKAAILHEIGLLLIPEATLERKKEERTDFEKALFMQHPVKGATLLSSCTEFFNCAEIIRYMNENADGTGKPEGLKKAQIPILSRILAGAEAFETLKEEQAMSSLEKIITKLEEYSGTRLDPIIAALLEKYAVLHMESGEYRIKGKGLHQLEPGMMLGTALFTNTGTKLFSAHTQLTREAIDKIKQYSREYPVDETVFIRV